MYIAIKVLFVQIIITISMTCSSFSENNSTNMNSMRAFEDVMAVPFIENGFDAPDNFYSALFFGNYTPSGSGVQRKCTATLIGPNVILTAAHCAEHNEHLEIEAKGKTYRAKCSQADEYVKALDASADYALCLLQPPMPDRMAETLMLRMGKLGKGTILLIAGYGCVEVGGDPDGTLRVGFSEVHQMPIAGHIPEHYITTMPDRKRQSPAVACKGDSGGPAFALKTTRDLESGRQLAGIISEVDGRKTLVTTLLSTHFQKFLRMWRDETKSAGIDVFICGYFEHALMKCHK